MAIAAEIFEDLYHHDTDTLMIPLENGIVQNPEIDPRTLESFLCNFKKPLPLTEFDPHADKLLVRDLRNNGFQSADFPARRSLSSLTQVEAIDLAGRLHFFADAANGARSFLNEGRLKTAGLSQILRYISRAELAQMAEPYDDAISARLGEELGGVYTRKLMRSYLVAGDWELGLLEQGNTPRAAEISRFVTRFNIGNPTIGFLEGFQPVSLTA